MKANRKAIMNDEEAVSPVIAVILMVAITVVLAATVFVLVNELGQDVGETGPNLGLSTASGTDEGQWNVRIVSATESAPIGEYNLLLTIPDGSDSTEWVDAEDHAHFWIDNDDDAGHCYELTSATGGGNLEVGERVTLNYEADVAEDPCTDTEHADYGTQDFETDFPTEEHELEFVHRPTGTSSGTLNRDF